MSSPTNLHAISLPTSIEDLRSQVRSFLDEQRRLRPFRPGLSMTAGHSPEFSMALAERGWLGMTIPERYGGNERGALERLIVTEELLSAGAPVAAHWVADRQSGPLIARVGSEGQKERFLPQ